MARTFVMAKEEQRTKVHFVPGIANVHRENNYNFFNVVFSTSSPLVW